MESDSNLRRKLNASFEITVKHNLDEAIEKLRQLNELLKETETLISAIRGLNT